MMNDDIMLLIPEKYYFDNKKFWNAVYRALQCQETSIDKKMYKMYVSMFLFY